VTIRDEMLEVVMETTTQRVSSDNGDRECVARILDILINRVPSVCPSGFDWTAGDIEDWLRAVREGRA